MSGRTDPPGAHYQLVAYVCGPGCVRPSPFEGVATFQQIFQQRPDGCRYAVVRSTSLYEGRLLDWAVWDFYAVKALLAPITIRPPTPRWVGDDPDALIMKAMVLYEQPDG